MSNENLTEDSHLFYEKYLPLKNHLQTANHGEDAEEGDKYAPGEVMGVDYYFETYGEELEFVKKHDTAYIWTLVQGDGADVICQGFRFVNRLSYFVTTVPWKEGERTEYIDLIDENEEEEN